MRVSWGVVISWVAFGLAAGLYLLAGQRAGERLPNDPGAASGAQADPNVLRFAPDAPQLSQLRLAAVGAYPEPLIEPLNARITYDENRTARIASPIAGRAVRIDVESGDAVRAGQPLVWLDAPEQAQAVADVVKSEAEVKLKRSAHARAGMLYEGEVLARKELEAAEADLRQAEAEHARARARLANLGTSVGADRFALRSPLAGIVTERSLNPGMEVRPDAATPLVVVTDPTSLWVVAELPERLLGKVHVGQRITLDVDAYPGTDFPGTVVQIGEVVDPSTRRVQVRCAVPNSGRLLKPEMYARVTPIAEQGGRLPRVPNAVIVARGVNTYVFVERAPGVLERRHVLLGLRGREDSYVASGLAEGERVVMTGAVLLNSELAGLD